MVVRKMLGILLAVTLCLMIAAPALASSANRQATDAQNAVLYAKVEVANQKIEAAVAWATLTPYNDVPWLLKKVDAIVKPVFRYAEFIGATVQCEYEQYYIDGQYVLIDPLRVVNVGGGTAN